MAKQALEKKQSLLTELPEIEGSFYGRNFLSSFF